MARLNRTPPPEDASRYEKRRYERIVQDDTDKRLSDIEDEQSYELSFQSAGIGAEIRLSNALPFVPNRFQITSGDGAFAVGKSKSKLADEDFIFLTTDAAYGTKFVARFWRK